MDATKLKKILLNFDIKTYYSDDEIDKIVNDIAQIPTQARKGMIPTNGQEKRRANFIVEVIQRNRKRPAKYKHYIDMPHELYIELRDVGIIDLETYFLDESAFLEVENNNRVRLSFISLYMCEDLHRKIDCYIIKQITGSYPLKRGGAFIL